MPMITMGTIGPYIGATKMRKDNVFILATLIYLISLRIDLLLIRHSHAC